MVAEDGLAGEPLPVTRGSRRKTDQRRRRRAGVSGQSDPPGGRAGGRWPSLLAAPAVALLCVALTHWKGMPLGADGWALWQGAVSLATGHGYSYFSGQPVLAWPPLYPLYLALWTLVLGPTGLSLVVAHGALIVLQAWLWAWLFRRIACDSGLPLTGTAQLLLSVFLGLFLCQTQPTVLAHTLVYTLLPLLLWALWRLVLRPPPRQERAYLALGIAVSGLLLLSHNAAIVFVAAAAAIVALRQPLSLRSIAGAAGLFLVPCLVWTLTRYSLGQSGSHHIGWGAGLFGPAAYLGQMVSGVGDLLLPSRSDAKLAALPLLLAAAALLSLTDRPFRQGLGLRLGLGFVAFAALFTLVLFTLSFVSNLLSSARFIGFLPLILLPLVFQAAEGRWPRTARIALLGLIAVQAYWTGLGARNQWMRSPAELGFVQDWEETSFVPLDARIDRSYRGRPPLATDKGILVAPPSFEEMPGRRQ